MAALSLLASLLMQPCLGLAEAPFARAGKAAAAAYGELAGGRPEGALEQASQAAALMEQELGAWHPRSALALRNQAVALWHLGRLSEAEALLLRAEAVLAAAGPTAGPQALRVSLDLAGLLADQGRAREAGARFARVLELAPAGALALEAALGAAPALATGGDLKAAGAVLAKARKGADEQLLQRLDQAQGELALAEGRPKEAYAAFGKALSSAAKALGAEHPFLAPHWEGQARALQAQGKREAAQTLWAKALEGRRRMAGLPSYASLPQLEAVAQDLIELGRGADAKSILKDVLKLRKELLGADHPACRKTQAQLNKLN